MIGTARLTPAQLASLAARSLSLDACRALADPQLPPDDPRHGEQLLVEWRRAVAGGDAEAFRRRLAWDDLTEDVARRLLARPGAPLPGEPPAWMLGVQEILADVAAGGSPLSPTEQTPTDVPEPLPFVDLWAPVAASARSRLEASVCLEPGVLDPAALDDLERHLLLQLVRTSELALYRRLETWRVRRPPDHGQHDGEAAYRSFVGELRSGGLATLLLDVPVLARQLVRLVDSWAGAADELLRRLVDDRTDLVQLVEDALTWPVVAIEPGLSDRHHGGRQVTVLRFASDHRVVYKPRGVVLEAAYNRLLAWLESAGLDPCPPRVRVLQRDDYGWVEHVRQASVGRPSEIRDYYRSAGVLLYLAWALNGGDLHMDNVIAGRDGPHLVDAEALLQPSTKASDDDASCLDSGLLSFVVVDADGDLADIGGLCGRGGHAAGSVRRWSGLGTARMGWEQEPVRAEAEQNLPLLNGVPQPPEPYGDALCSGFADAHACMARHRRRLLSSDGPLSDLAAAVTRIVLRPSNRYAVLLDHLTAPTAQSLGVRHSILIDSLNRVFVGASQRPVLWPLVRDERAALENLDVPVFTIGVATRRLLTADGEAVDGYYARSGLEVLRERLERLDDTHLQRQLQAIERAALSSSPTSWSDSSEVTTGGDTDRVLRELCLELVDALLREHLAPADDEMTWAAPAAEASANRFLPPDLGNGVTGVLLFLAAAAAHTGHERPRHAAESTARHLRRLLAEAPPDGALGILDGLGGIVYGLVRAAGLLDLPELMDEAARVAARIDQHRIDRGEVLDVAGGLAGGVLGLLALHRAAPRTDLLERALACGRRLAEHAVTTPAGGVAWPTRDGVALAGFAHGASGIALSLGRLGVAAEDDGLVALARRGLAGECELYDTASGNWPLLQRRSPGGPVERIPMVAWCHGAPGVAMARVGLLGTLDDDSLRSELATALATTLRHPLGGPDHLCCGNLGRTDVSLTAGGRLEREDLLEAAWEQATMVIRRAAVNGGFCLEPRDHNPRPGLHPGLFHGVSGIGYQLLRLAAPDRLPSLLLLSDEGG